MPVDPALIGMAANSAQQVQNTMLGLMMEGHNDKRQLKQQSKLQQLQIAGSKELTDYNYAKQLQMWKDTNFGAQLAEMKKAGLSPGLMYGGSGGGGATTGGGGGSVAGAQAPSGGGEVMAMMLNMQQQKAQIELMKAQTNKTNVEAGKIGGVDIQLAQTQIADLTQGIENKKAQKMLTDVQTHFQQLENTYKTETLQAAIAKTKFETDIALQTLNILKNDAIISEETWSVKVDMIQTQAAQMVLQNGLLESNVQVNEAQIQEIMQRIKTQVKQLEQGDRALSQKDKDILIDQERNKLIEKGIWVGGATQVLGTAVDIFTKGKKPTYNDNRKTYYLER